MSLWRFGTVWMYYCLNWLHAKNQGNFKTILLFFSLFLFLSSTLSLSLRLFSSPLLSLSLRLSFFLFSAHTVSLFLHFSCILCLCLSIGQVTFFTLTFLQAQFMHLPNLCHLTKASANCPVLEKESFDCSVCTNQHFYICEKPLPKITTGKQTAANTWVVNSSTKVAHFITWCEWFHLFGDLSFDVNVDVFVF